MGNLGSSPTSPLADAPSEEYAITRAERWALAKRCVALLQIHFPDANLETVLLLPRDVFLRFGHMPSFVEAKPHLRPVLSLVDKKKYPMGPGKALYMSNAAGDHLEKRWVPGGGNHRRASSEEVAAKAAAAAAMAAGGAVAVAVAAAAAGAAQAAAGAAIARRASAAGEAADLYATARAFMVENPEFQHIWVGSACMPPRLREQKWRGALPSANGSNMFEHLHPGALLACDAVLVIPPERESMTYVAEHRERYTDLETYSTSPWKALEGVIVQLMNSVSFYAFRLGNRLIFAGPYPSYPEEPQPSPLHVSSRRSSAAGTADSSPRGGLEDSRSVPTTDSPVVDKAKAAMNMFLPRIGWNALPAADQRHNGGKDHEESRWNGGHGWDAGGGCNGSGGAGGAGGGRSAGSTPTASVRTASMSEASSVTTPAGVGRSDRSRRRGGGDGAALAGPRIERAVREALDRLQITGAGSPAERNWRGVLQPCFLLRKAREDVEKYSDARGALKQAMCSMSVSLDQAEEFFGVWKYLGVLGPCSASDRLAALNLVVFAISVADGYCCPRRPRDFISRVMEESLVTTGHLDLWMKDLSPDDSRSILRHVNSGAAGKLSLSVLTIGSSHTAGAGVGTFLRGHSSLKELELEWEGVRDLSSIAQAVGEHRSLTRLNLTHNEIGPRGAIQLAGALRKNRSLTELDLRENSLGPTGMKAIADALASNDTMRTLYLQDNGIGDDGVIHMTEALMRNGRLRTVCLDGNKVTKVGALVIRIAIKMNPALKLLSLSRNDLPDESKRALYDAWSQREVEEDQTRTGMFLDRAAEGTFQPGREGWRANPIPTEGVFVSTRGGTGSGGGLGVLVSPTREQNRGHDGSISSSSSSISSSGSISSNKSVISIPQSGNGGRSGKSNGKSNGNINSNGSARSGGGESGGPQIVPRLSPVSDTTFAPKKPLW